MISKKNQKIVFNFFINLATGWSAGMFIASTALPFFMVFGNLPLLSFVVGAAAVYASFMLVKQFTKTTQYECIDHIKFLEEKAKTLDFLNSDQDDLVLSIKKVNLLALQRKRTMKSLMLAGTALVAVWTLGSALVTSLTIMHIIPAGLFIAGTLSGPIGIAFLLLAIAAAMTVFAWKLRYQNSQQGMLNGENLLQMDKKLQRLEANCDQWLKKTGLEKKPSIMNKMSAMLTSPVAKMLITVLSTFSLFFSIGKLLAVLPLIAVIWTPPVWIITLVAISFGLMAGIICYEREREILVHVPTWNALKAKTQIVAEKLNLIEESMTPRIENKSLADQIKSAFALARFEYQHSVLAQINLRSQLRKLQQRFSDMDINEHLIGWLESRINETQTELTKMEKRTAHVYKIIYDLGQTAEEFIGNKFLVGLFALGSQIISKHHSQEEIPEKPSVITEVNVETYHFVRSTQSLQSKPCLEAVDTLPESYSLSNY